jgi:hypothetical protein
MRFGDILFYLAVLVGVVAKIMGYLGWLSMLALLVAVFLFGATINALPELRRRQQIRFQYQQTLAEKRRSPDWTGKECVSCGKPIPLNTKVGDSCPHCRQQFGQEIRV